jgi:hypothetical protein
MPGRSGPIRPDSRESDRKRALQTYARALKADLSSKGIAPGNPERKLKEKAFVQVWNWTTPSISATSDTH